MAFVTVVIVGTYDQTLSEDDAFESVYESLESSRPLDLALAAVTLIAPLLRQVAELRDELPEDVLRMLAMEAAERPLLPPNLL